MAAATVVTNKTVRRQEGFIMTSSVCHQGITIIGETQPQVIHSKPPQIYGQFNGKLAL